MGGSVSSPPPYQPDQSSLTVIAGQLAIKNGGVTDAKIAAPLKSATLAGSPSAGAVLTCSDGTNSAWGTALVQTSATTTGANATSVTISCSAGHKYLLLYRILSNVGSDNNCAIQWNTTNYARGVAAVCAGGGANVIGYGATDIGHMDAAGDYIHGWAYIDTNTASKALIAASASLDSGNNRTFYNTQCVESDSTTAQTAITVVCQAANGIKAGSRFVLYQLD